ncbi:MAG: hypothetical protein OEW37_07125 [Rhodospirillaceae bacterium]|nr:hypothetical protein [Rhodospirillaceae bacterium]
MTLTLIKQAFGFFRRVWVVELIYVAVWSAFMFWLSNPIKPGTITDLNVDAYVRLERIYQWLNGGDWFEKILLRVGASDHLVLHWTRPLDLLVAPFAIALEPMFGLHDAVYLAGPLLSLPVGIIFFAMAAKLPVICGERQPVMLERAAIFVFLIPHFLSILLPQNWPDHHGLLLLLFLASLLSTHKMIEGNKLGAWALGLILALGVWVSVESIIGVLAINAGLGLLWVSGLEKNTAKMALRAALGMFGGIALALVLEFGTSTPNFALDRISAFYLALAGGIAIVWLVASSGESKLANFKSRIISGATLTIAIAIALFLIRPELIHGPMADADKWFMRVWGGAFGDGFMFGTASVYLIVSAGFASAVYMALREKKQRIASLLFLPGMAIFTALVFFNSPRWSTYAEIISVIFIIPVFARLYRYMEKQNAIRWKILMVSSIVLLFFTASLDAFIRWARLPAFVTQYYMPPALRTVNLQTPEPADQLVAPNKIDYEINKQGVLAKRCDLEKLLQQINKYAGTKELVIMAHPQITPAILFHSRHRVASVPIHPDGPAVQKTFDAITTTNAAFPSGTGADVLMLCFYGKDKIFYGQNPDSLYVRLSQGSKVAGLEQIAQSGESYKLYKIINP